MGQKKEKNKRQDVSEIFNDNPASFDINFNGVRHSFESYESFLDDLIWWNEIIEQYGTKPFFYHLFDSYYSGNK